MTLFACRNCHKKYPNQIVVKCLHCGGAFLDIDIVYEKSLEDQLLPGIWPYKQSFGLPKNSRVVSLGEGNTPLINYQSSNIYFKAEYQNPTGSFKDRLIAPIVSLLLSMGIEEAVEDSSGNAGAAFAAYASSVGIKSKVFVPSYASGPKRIQIERYGAELMPIDGTRQDTTVALQDYVEENNSVYASHALIPHGIAGISTIAYEMVDQLKGFPDFVVCPVGHGSLMVGLALGFSALYISGIISNIPKIIGVQSEVFSPVYNLMSKKENTLLAKTIAEGASVKTPAFLNWINENSSKYNLGMVVVKENEIIEFRDELAKMGFYVEDTSAIVWPIMKNIAENNLDKKVVGILTGSGLKSS